MSRAAHPKPSRGWSSDWLDRVLDWASPNPGAPPVAAIAGLQGSGKSTLAAQLAALAGERGYHALALSIDDFYLTRRQRRALARNVHPLLATRGPPGSHDLALACDTLDALRTLKPGQHVPVPRFDKLGDRRLPPSRWREVRRRPDLIVFEGWFLKTPPEPDQALIAPVNDLEREQDPDAVWRRWCNRRLAEYAPLWRRLDRLLFLRAPDFEVVPDWRWQQERDLCAASPGRTGMDRAEVERFVRLFERVGRQAQRRLPEVADWTVALDERRRPVAATGGPPDQPFTRISP